MTITADDLTPPDVISSHDLQQMNKLIRHAGELSSTTPYAKSQLLAYAAKLCADIEAGEWDDDDD